jgi:hypothetical protein
MTFAVPVLMKRFLALLLLVALPLQGLAVLATHVFPEGDRHGAPATLLQAHGAQHDGSAADHHASLPVDEAASCCVFAGSCHGNPGLIARFWSPLAAGFTTEPVIVAFSSFTSFSPESPERPPLATL